MAATPANGRSLDTGSLGTRQVRARLVAGAATDPAERAADNAADQVLRMAAPEQERPTAVDPTVAEATSGGPGAATSIPPEIQPTPAALRAAAPTAMSVGGPIPEPASIAAGGPVPAGSPPPSMRIRSQAVADHDPHHDLAVPARTERYLDQSQGTGRPLPDGTRRYFETRFSTDFRAVRVHDDNAAGQASRSLGALAFARGRDIWFSAGAYDTSTDGGRRLLAHELAHVAQQNPGIGRRAAAVPSPGTEAGNGPPSVPAQAADLRATASVSSAPRSVHMAADAARRPADDRDPSGIPATMNSPVRIQRCGIDSPCDCTPDDQWNGPHRSAIDHGPDDPLERSADETARKALHSAMPGTAAREEVPASVRPSFGPAVIQRSGLDPANVAAWDWYARERHRRDPSFLETVSAAAGAAQQIEKQLATTQVPKTDDERKAFERQVLTLIRLDAVKLVGQHRSELAARKQQFEEMATAPPGGAQSATAGADVNYRAADLANAIRAAAAYVTRLNAEKWALDDLRAVINRTVHVDSGPEAIDEEFRTLWRAAQPNSAPFALQRLLEAQVKLQSPGLSWTSKKMVLIHLSDDLYKLRTRQTQGIDIALALTFTSFPFLADVNPWWITTGKHLSPTSMKTAAYGLSLVSLISPAMAPDAAVVVYEVFKTGKPPDDQTLLASVRTSFDRLLNNTDEAIAKVGSGDIHPLDLPGAVAAARSGLPEALRPELDRLKQEHEVAKFATEMILALGMAVLTGLTGGLAGIGLAAYATATGAAAAGIGVAQLGAQLKDMLDRQTLAGASTDPNAPLLGVSAPSLFEWTMFGVSAVLTAADLAALARELGAFKPAFKEEPRVTAGQGEASAGPKVGEPTADRPSTPAAADKPLEPGTVRPRNSAEARLLDAGRTEAVPSLEQLDTELAVVERTEPRKLGSGEYVEEVQLPNGHTWRRSADGNWCRFSDGRICVPGFPGKGTSEVIKSAEDVDKLLEPLRPQLERPPVTVRTPEDLAMWELYNDYFAERVSSMRGDLQAVGRTERDLPRDFESFRKTYTDNPELVNALRGRLAQSGTGEVLSKLTGGKVAQNLGISKVAEPAIGEVVYPDFVWQEEGKGYTAMSSKNRDFSRMTGAEVDKWVRADVDEMLGKYYGQRYVRRRGLEVTGQQIDIDQVVLNYTTAGLSDEFKADVSAIARDYGGAGIDVSFFEFR
jgi:hypothetical protein